MSKAAVTSDVSIGPAPESAIACTAIGCPRSVDLYRVEKAGEVRILCVVHLRGWLRR